MSEAWYTDVKQSTIVNCFVKGGFVKTNDILFVNDENMDPESFGEFFEQLDDPEFDTFEGTANIFFF